MQDLLSIPVEKLEGLGLCDWAYTEDLSAKSYDQFSAWIKSNLHGVLGYLSDERKEKRRSLSEVYPQTQSALIFLFDYTGEKKRLISEDSKLKVASYASAFGKRDYHFEIKERIQSIMQELEVLDYKIIVDTAPVLERDLAYRAGLGWFGKNSMLISKAHGSYFLIGSVLLTQKLQLGTREVETDHCGHCTKCLEACPTEAIRGDRTLVADRCISTYTIEVFKESEPPKGYPTQTSEVFGCDICQEVCPWNSKPIKNAVFSPNEETLLPNKSAQELIDWLSQMSKREFKRVFKDTVMERTGRDGLIKNLNKLI